MTEVPLGPGTVRQDIGSPCGQAMWGPDIDIDLRNTNAFGKVGYVQVLFDWNHDGQWGGMVPCGAGMVDEFAVQNVVLPTGYIGQLSGLMGGALLPLGPSGYVCPASPMSSPRPRGFNSRRTLRTRWG